MTTATPLSQEELLAEYRRDPATRCQYHGDSYVMKLKVEPTDKPYRDRFKVVRPDGAPVATTITRADAHDWIAVHGGTLL